MSEGKMVFLLTDRGELHHGFEVGKQLLTDEGCNIDDSAKEQRFEERLPPDTPFHPCERCFPDGNV